MRLRLLVFFVTLIAFARLTTCQFTWWDDQDTIHHNRWLNPPTWKTLEYYWTTASEHQTMGLYVPMTYTVWSGLAKIGRLDHPDDQGITVNAFVFHTANVLLHAITALLVFQLLWRLFNNQLAATLGALLFALHPVQVEAVGWVSGTKDLLYGFFGLASLLMYVKSTQLKIESPANRTKYRARYVAGLLLFVLAMFSKPTGVVIPLMAAVLSVLILKQTLRQTILSLLPWFILMIPCIIWTQRVQPPSWVPPLPIWTRPLVASDAIAFYFYKLVWPLNLCIDYGRNPQAIVASHQIYFTWIALAFATAMLWFKRNRMPPVVAGFLLFLIPLLPVLGFVPFEFQMLSTTADHYLYLPMLGVAIVLAWFLTNHKSRLINQVAIAMLVIFTIRTWRQEPVWQDSRSLYLHALAVNPHSDASMCGMGFVAGQDARQFELQGKPEQAQTNFNESIWWYSQSLKMNPGSTPSMLNLALNYQKIGREDLGRDLLQQIVALQPKLPPGLQADPLRIAHLLINFHDLPAAINWLDDVTARDPANIPAELLREETAKHLNQPNR